MNNLDEILKLGNRKKEKFAAYEEATNKMLSCEVDDIEKYITQRGEIANEIDYISEEIGRACDGIANGKIIIKALKNDVDYTQMPPEFQPLYNLGQETRTIVYRIQQADVNSVSRFENLRKDALVKIKENQNIPKIKKYLTDIVGQPAEIRMKDNKA